jgi:hypothetical protein
MRCNNLECTPSVRAEIFIIIYFRLRNTEIMNFAVEEMISAVDKMIFAGILLFLPAPK